MSHRPPLMLALAVTLAACTPPATTYDQKVAKVEQLTKALSLTQNAELRQATQSVSTLSGSMSQGGFRTATAAASGIVAAGGGNIVAAGGGNILVNNGGNVVSNNGGSGIAANFVLAALAADLNAAMRNDVYKLAGTLESNGATITYDDATGELSGISDATTTCAFAFKNEGSKRTWTIDVRKSPDGTTGTMAFEITADRWTAAPTGGQPQPAAPVPSGQDEDWWGDEEPEDEGDPEDEGPDDEGYDPDLDVMQAGGGAQLKVFNNEVPDPNTLTAFRFACDLKPQGNEALRVKLDAVIDDVKVVNGGRTPTRLGLDLTVPTLQFKSSTSFDGATRFTSAGTLKVRTPEATESLRYDLAMLLGENTGTFDLFHEGAKVKLGLVAAKGDRPGVPTTSAGLYDVETNAKIADLVQAPGEQNVVLINFTSGKVVRWDVASGTTAQVPGATGGTSAGSSGGASPRPSAAPTPRPTPSSVGFGMGGVGQ